MPEDAPWFLADIKICLSSSLDHLMHSPPNMRRLSAGKDGSGCLVGRARVAVDWCTLSWLESDSESESGSSSHSKVVGGLGSSLTIILGVCSNDVSLKTVGVD